VYIVFGTVLNVATIMLGDFLGGERIVVDFTFYRVIFLALVGYRLQERSTA
jgi:hypothetical protein